MAMPSHLQVVLGATGGVGQALVQALAAQGAQVRAVNRSGRASVPASVEVMAADLTNRESTRTACQGAASRKKADDGADASWPILARGRTHCRSADESINGVPLVASVPHTRRNRLARWQTRTHL
jgi:uncharacterized protein YbjT (DUF2867 family)